MPTALVTGTNSGIGQALTLQLVKRGYTVYATDIVFFDATKELFMDNNNNSNSVRLHIMDVTSPEAVARVKALVEEEVGSLDLLYCNAGRVKVALSTDLQEEDIRSIYELNLFAPIRLVREFVHLVIKAKGTIAFSGSVTKALPLHSNSLYTSSKAALDQYASVLQCELRNFDVKVIDVVGGYIKTNIFESGVATVREGSPFDFAEYSEVYAKRSAVLEKSKQQGMAPEEFARRVLDKLDRATVDTLRIYEGAKAGRLALLLAIAPQRRVVDSMLNLFSLNFDYRKHLK